MSLDLHVDLRSLNFSSADVDFFQVSISDWLDLDLFWSSCVDLLKCLVHILIVDHSLKGVINLQIGSLWSIDLSSIKSVVFDFKSLNILLLLSDSLLEVDILSSSKVNISLIVFSLKDSQIFQILLRLVKCS